MSLHTTPAHQDGADQATGRIFDDYYDRDEAAAELDVSPRTLARWHRYREGPPRTVVGRKVLYHKQSLREWVRAHEQSTN